MILSSSEAIRLMSKYTRSPTGCWEAKKLTKHGYGNSIWLQGRSWGLYKAVYVWLVGPVPEGLELDHLCRNRACVRPSHLEPVPPSVNVRRGMGQFHNNAAILKARTHCKNGHLFDEANTRINTDGSRGCQACGRAKSAKQYAAKKSLTPGKGRRKVNPKTNNVNKRNEEV